MKKTLELLAEKPLVYEYERPIFAIERVLESGLAVASEARMQFIDGKWRSVKIVSVRS